MNKTYKTIFSGILFAVLLLSLPPLQAQQDNKINPKVEVQRDYEGRMSDIEKPKLSTVVPDSISKFNFNVDYSIFDKPYHDLYSFTPLPFIHLSSPGSLKQPWAHIRLGLTWPTTPETDVFLQAPLSGVSALLLTAQHQSFWGELPRYRQGGQTIADQMQNTANIRYTLHSEKVHFEIGGGGDYNYYTYYGISPYYPESFSPANLYGRSFMRDSMSHTYHRYKANLSLSSPKSVEPGAEWSFSFEWSLLEDFARLWQTTSVSSCKENLFRFKGGVGVRLKPDQIFGFELSGSFANNLYSSVLDRGVFVFNPYYQIHKNRFSLLVGGILSGTHNYVKEFERMNKFFFYPHLEASYQIVPKNLLVYTHIRGEDRLNDYQSLLTQNPWLSQNLELRSSNTSWMIDAGIKGKIAHHLGYQLYGQYVQTNNQYFFKNTPYRTHTDQDLVYLNSLFTIHYADEDRLSAVAALSWNSHPLTLHLKGQYHAYKLSSGEPAWYKPKVELSSSARYQWRERIIISADVAYRGMVSVPEIILPDYYNMYESTTSIESATKLNGFVDIGVTLEYRFASWFGLYAQVKNLLHAEQQYYLYYLEPGIRIGGGVTFRF